MDMASTLMTADLQGLGPPWGLAPPAGPPHTCAAASRWVPAGNEHMTVARCVGGNRGPLSAAAASLAMADQHCKDAASAGSPFDGGAGCCIVVAAAAAASL